MMINPKVRQEMKSARISFEEGHISFKEYRDWMEELKSENRIKIRIPIIIF